MLDMVLMEEQPLGGITQISKEKVEIICLNCECFRQTQMHYFQISHCDRSRRTACGEIHKKRNVWARKQRAIKKRTKILVSSTLPYKGRSQVNWLIPPERNNGTAKKKSVRNRGKYGRNRYSMRSKNFQTEDRQYCEYHGGLGLQESLKAQLPGTVIYILFQISRMKYPSKTMWGFRVIPMELVSQIQEILLRH